VRKLSDEDRRLWERLKETVHPLPGHRPPKPADAKTAGESSGRKIAKIKHAETSSLPKKAEKAPPSPPALVRLEERTRRRLSRGLVPIDDRIDLHGMRQERAHSSLTGFLRRAQVRGNRVVLVVTGKGTAGEDGRGVLREMVPHWLSRPDLRDLVVGYEEAGRRHGGAGALYVRIRRRREARRPAS
jgi:DNA-nicking Smr family endonuclease